jgi:hypothetical protein
MKLNSFGMKSHPKSMKIWYENDVNGMKKYQKDTQGMK